MPKNSRGRRAEGTWRGGGFGFVSGEWAAPAAAFGAELALSGVDVLGGCPLMVASEKQASKALQEEARGKKWRGCAREEEDDSRSRPFKALSKVARR